MGSKAIGSKTALTGKGRVTKIIAGLTNGLIYSSGFRDSARKNAADFTRNRKMSFEEVVFFMLTSMRCSTQTSLRRFFAGLGKGASIKQQSFSEARAKINVSAFVQLFRLTVGAMTENLDDTWRGFLIYAIDGSRIALPADERLRGHFGTVGRGGSSPTAQGSILYDVLNDIVVDAMIEPISSDERTLAAAHLDSCKDYAPGARKLFILDRGYPSFGLIRKMEDDGFNYLMRVRDKFNCEIDAQEEADGHVLLERDGERIRVRVVKLKLDGGEIETLITNIPDDCLEAPDFKELYFMRWPVETKYDLVKNKLQLENFSSRTVEGVQQDFFAAMYLTNVAAAAASDAQAGIDGAREGKGNKYRYKANMNELIGILKDRLVLAIAEDSERRQAKLVRGIIDEITKSVVPKRGNRSLLRNPSPRNSKFHHNQKVNC